ncbi:MAG TPA: TolC family protein [Polyangiaceae bacterium]|nr:TolC family protein [Polyangiaceae bacterium]
MRTSAVLALSVLSACAPSAIRPDLRAVQRHAQAPVLPALPAARVDPELHDDARSVLEAPLDEDAAVRIALLNNRELRARLRELGVSRGQLLQAGLIANPSLEAELSPERESRYELRAEYDIMSFVLAPLRKQAARFELEAARLSVAGDVVELGYQVRTAFYALAAAEQNLRVASHTLDALAAGRDAANALFAAGNLRELDASSQISAFERARIVVAKLELTLLEQREALQRLLGLHGTETEWSLRSELAPAPDAPPLAEDMEARALKANLDLAAAQQRLYALAKRTGITRTEGLLPHIELDVHALIGNPNNEEQERHVRWGGGVGVDVPLFDRKQGTLRAQEAEFDGALERFHGQAIALRSAVREARGRVLSAHKRAQQYQSVIVPAQAKVMEHSLLQYNAMQLGVFQLLEARRAELEVALDYNETLREYWSAKAELDALLAGRVVGQGARASAMPSGLKGARAEEGH